MMHSIIIPLRRRFDALTLCLWSLTEASRMSDLGNFEIVLVNQGDWPPNRIPEAPNLRVVPVPDDGGPFNKSRLLNLGIAAARGELLSFLDCDMVVAPGFFDSAWRARDRRLTRLCYRVRSVPADWLPVLVDMPAPERARFLALAFDRYDDFPRAYEAYCNPDYNPAQPLPNQLLFGNSQFTIRRDALGDLRYDEGQVGRGFEDLDMIWRIWKKHFVSYHAELADRQLLHLAHGHSADWLSDELTAANLARYKAARHVL